eukprot:362560-Chlamydomonas_euryale.AAC.9
MPPRPLLASPTSTPRPSTPAARPGHQRLARNKRMRKGWPTCEGLVAAAADRPEGGGLRRPCGARHLGRPDEARAARAHFCSPVGAGRGAA